MTTEAFMVVKIRLVSFFFFFDTVYSGRQVATFWRKHTTYIFIPGHGDNMYLWEFEIHLPEYTVSLFVTVNI